MKRKFSIIVLFLGLFGGIWADASAQTPDETDCFARLVRAESKFLSLESYACDLKVTSLSKAEQGGHAETGEYFFRKGAYHMDFSEDEIICDGEQMQTWYKAFGDAKIVDYEPAKDITLGGIYRLYASGHTARWEGEEAGREKIVFEATADDAPFFKKEVWIGLESGLIEQYTLWSRNWGSFLYEMTEVRLNGELDDSLFKISPEFVEKVRNGEIPVHDVHADHDH